MRTDFLDIYKSSLLTINDYGGMSDKLRWLLNSYGLGLNEMGLPFEYEVLDKDYEIVSERKIPEFKFIG